MSLIGALNVLKAGQAAKKTAPFYSAVDEALANLKRPKGTGAEFLTELSKQPGVKKAEIADRKLDQAFKAKGKITKEEAQQVLKDNPPPKLQEREYNEKAVREEEDIREELAQEMYGRSYDDLSHRERRPVFDETQRIMGEENGPQYGDYKTPGGENYREILLKLPESFTKNDFNRLLTLEAEQRRGELTTAQLKELVDLQAKKQTGPSNYISRHWKEDPNVLAHMRVQDRTGPNGEKILHVEEIQSDWHQEARKKGYVDQTVIELQNEFNNYKKNLPERFYQKALSAGYSEKEAQELAQDLMNPDFARGLGEEGKFEAYKQKLKEHENKVPDAPFKKNWHELAMKRLLNYAADNGYDSIAITPGAEQANRYKLSKQIDELIYSEDGSLYASKGGRKVFNQRVSPDQLPDYVGKEVAEKLVSAQPNEVGSRVIGGLDLEVGGEGMKGFYDQILPSYLNTFGKPYGTQVELNAQRVDIPRQEFFGDNPIEARTLNLHNFRITPEMRESIKQKGLPLYQQIGIPTVGAGAASQVPEQEEGMAGGGSIAKMTALAKLKKMRDEMAPRAEAVKNLIAKDANAYLRDVVPNSLTNAEIEAEIKRMAARAKASGQQEGVLPRAERDANLAKFMMESKVRDKAFHGPGRHSGITDIDQFKTDSHTGGAWFASNPDYASEFGSGYTMPVHLNMTNPLDLSKFGNKSLTVNEWIKAMDEAGVDTSEMQIKPARVLGGANKQGEPNYDLWELLWRADDGQNNIPEVLKKQGFDGILAPPEYDSKTANYVVFEPTQVKSALGNRGTFDPNDPDIRKAIGGAVKRQVKKADGGAINYNTAPDMSDGGRIIQGAPFKRGGKVNMTANRDTMFLELSNKKLKRK